MFQKQSRDADLNIGPACAHLRSKAIYVTGDQQTPDHYDEDGSHYCWCNLTQHIIGPDDQDVTRRQCTSGRDCFKQSGL